jgi:23S rRNA pseudouridine1911/1915/1917 synthase
MIEMLTFVVPETSRKQRLDHFLFDRFSFLSRMYLREVVRDGLCEVNGRHENRGYELKPGDFVEVNVDTTRHATMHPEKIFIEVVYEDELLLVVNKPPGMLVHPTVGVRSGTLLNALAHHLNASAIEDGSTALNRAGLIHRLDKDTSGLIVVAKDKRAHRILASHFQRKLVEKRYYAVVNGRPDVAEGTIDLPIGRSEEERIWRVDESGKPATTKFRIIRSAGGLSLMDLEPVTGRTNQLRIHLAAIGTPIVGDEKYGGAAYKRLCLHSRLLKFKHPTDGRVLEFHSGVPKDFPLTDE